MRFLNRWPVGAKLGAAFGVVLLLLVGVGAFAIAQLSAVQRESAQIAGNWMPSSVGVLRASREISRYRTTQYRQMLAPPEDRDAVLRLLDERLKAVDNAFAQYEPLISSDQERALFSAMKSDWAAYLDLSRRMEAELKTGASAAALKLLTGDSLAQFNAISKVMDALVALNNEGATAATQHSGQIYQRGRSWIIFLVLAAVLSGAAFAILMTRMICRPLACAVGLAQAVANGDLTQEVAVVGHDELAQLLQAQTAMMLRLRGIVSDVRSGVDSISTASAQIAAGNQDLSARTEQAAANLQETASSMEELTGTVGHTADTARQANQLAVAAAESATRGGEVVSRVTDSMRRIDASSRRIADIIGVIDSIAFQTNILALNAAVEAARAGAQGRGFAVVAAEVRMLAQRSAAAAREIKTLIGASAETVALGSEQVEAAGAVMLEIVASVRRVNDLMAEIAAAASEQRDGISQVNQAVTHLDRVTQQNAALVQESAAAAASLLGQAQGLSAVVSVFRVAASPASVLPQVLPRVLPQVLPQPGPAG